MTTRQIKRTLRRTEKLFGFPRGWLLKIATLESALNPAAVNKSSGATGLFQFLSGTAAEENINPLDVLEATVATAKRLRRFRNHMGHFGIASEHASELALVYLSHQQGTAGIVQIVSVVNGFNTELSEARLRNMEANFPGALKQPGMTDHECAVVFLKYWDDRVA